MNQWHSQIYLAIFSKFFLVNYVHSELSSVMSADATQQKYLFANAPEEAQNKIKIAWATFQTHAGVSNSYVVDMV
jgi:hypothetical protein